MRFLLIFSLLYLCGFFQISLAIDPNIACASCVMLLGLSEQVNIQINFLNTLVDYCESSGDHNSCKLAAYNLVYGMLEEMRPEELCDHLSVCNNEENGWYLWPEWPVSLPPAPKDWPTERRILLQEEDYIKIDLKEGKFDCMLDMTPLIPFFDGF